MKKPFLQGYIAIVTVLALLVFSLSLLVTVPYFSIGGAQRALILFQGEATLAALEGCAEDALLLSARDENYIGATRDYFGARCDVSIEKDDAVWTLSLIGIKDGLTRTLTIVVNRTPGTPGTLILQSWLEE